MTFSRCGDGEGVERRGQEEVEQQPARDRREQRRAQPADQGGDHGDQEEQHDVGRQPEHVAAEHPDPDGGQGQQQAQRPPGGAAARRDGAEPPRKADPAAGLGVGDRVHVDVPGVLDHPGPDALDEDTGEPGAPRGAEDELRGVDPAGELQQRRRDVVADDGVERGADVVGEPPQPGQCADGSPGEAVAAQDVHGEQLGRAGPLGDAGGATQDRLALRAAGQRHDDAFAGLPDVAGLLVAPVPLQRDLDLVGEPEQGHLAQCGEVARLEVVGHRRVDLLGAVDVAVRHPAAQRLRCDVDEFDLLRAPDDLVRDGLLLAHTGDPLDDVVERLEVLDVDGGQHGDPGVEDVLDVLPALGVPRAGRVGVGELVDQYDVGSAGEHRVDVQLGQLHPAVGHGPPGQDLQPLDQGGGLGPVVGLDQPDGDVGAPLGAAVRLAEHGEGLADPGRRAQVDPQLAARPHDVIIRLWWRGPRRSPGSGG